MTFSNALPQSSPYSFPLRGQGVVSFQLKPGQPVHFVGVGGIGMSALARLLVGAGYPVSGSDMKTNAQTDWLVANGATIFNTHSAENVPAHAVVVLSTAITTDNPERLIAAQRAQVVVHRSELLRELLHGKALHHTAVVGVSGTHGKTTMTGMLGQVLLTAGLDPTIIAGGILPAIDSNARWGGKRQVAVAELDESDGSIVQYTPTHLIIANLELDHADHYPGGLAQIEKTFEHVLVRLPVGSVVVYNMDCPTTSLLVRTAGKHLKTVSVSLKDPTADIYAHQPTALDGNGYRAKVFVRQQPVQMLQTAVPGLHNLHNALLVFALALKLDVSGLTMPPDTIAAGILQFTGMGRRFERIAEPDGVLLVDDYGHHPTEVQVTLAAARELAESRKGQLTVVFQPHRYTRLKTLWAEFTQAFGLADNAIITDVYAAGEPPLIGVDGQALSAAINGSFVPKTEWGSLKQRLLSTAKAGDVLLSMGAGDITRLWRSDVGG